MKAMTLVIILLCLATQRAGVLPIHKPRLDWIVIYYNRLEAAWGNRTWWQGAVGVAILLGSIAALYGIFIPLLTHWLGMVFSFLFQGVVLWYYLDAQPEREDCVAQTTLTEFFMHRYYSLFAILFWYVVLGPLGIILYAENRRLAAYLKAQQASAIYFPEDFLQKLNLVRAVMDWVPVRLVGLTYALVGQFRPAFAHWYRQLVGIQTEPMLVVDYGMLALNWDAQVVLSCSAEQIAEAQGLVTRALIVWVILMVVFTL